MEYRGFTITQRDGQWWAVAGAGTLELGPFANAALAVDAVDAAEGDSGAVACR